MRCHTFLGCQIPSCLLIDWIWVNRSLRSNWVIILHIFALPWSHKWSLVLLIVVRVFSSSIGFILLRGRSIFSGSWHIERSKSWREQWRWRICKILLMLLLHLVHLVVHILHVHDHLCRTELSLDQLQVLMMRVEASNSWVLSKVAH